MKKHSNNNNYYVRICFKLNITFCELNIFDFKFIFKLYECFFLYMFWKKIKSKLKK